MALSSVIRRASSPMLPLAIRAVGSPRSFHGAIATTVNVHQRTIPSPKSLFQSQSSYSSAAGPTVAKKAVDDSLIRIINSQIKSSKLVHEIPKRFPFTVEDSSVEGTLMLTREDADEKITVEVDKTALGHLVPEEDSVSSDSESENTNDSDDDSCEETNTDKNKDNSKNNTNDTDDSCDDSDSDSDSDSDDSDDNGEDNKKETRFSSFPITVSVIKGNGIALEFDVMASSDNIAIQTLAIKESTECVDEYEGPEFLDLDPELKHALHRYLEIRGIKPTMAENLQKYKMYQKRVEELQWLKKLKKFIKK